MREGRGGDQRGVLDAHAVVDFVALLEAAQDGDGRLDARLGDKDRLEAALQAGSFSMCLRYSSRVVAPMQRSSPRASCGFMMLAASVAPSAAPAPTIVCSSSMNSTILPSLANDLP
jgi:hypothetical protein